MTMEGLKINKHYVSRNSTNKNITWIVWHFDDEFVSIMKDGGKQGSKRIPTEQFLKNWRVARLGTSQF